MRWLLLALVAVSISACFADKPVTRLTDGRTTLRKVVSFEAPDTRQTAVVVAPGDFILSGNGLRIVIGGLRRRREARGAILEATVSGIPVAESIVLLQDVLYVRGVERAIDVQRMFMFERESVPTLRIEGTVLLGDRVIEVTRDLALSRAQATLSINTRLSTLSLDGEQDVRLGARIAWGGAVPFMAGVGALDDDAWHRGVVVGAQGPIGGAAFGYEQGTLATRAVHERRGAGEFLLHTEVVSARRIRLQRATPVYQKSLFSLASTGLARAARVLGFARGKPFGEVWIDLPYRPEGAEVRLTDGTGRPFMVGRPDEAGRVVLPLLPGDAGMPTSFQVVAVAYGHAPSETVALARGGPRSLPLHIPRGGQIRVRVRDAVGGGPIPARVRLLPLEKAAPLDLGPDYRASGAGDTVVTLDGEAEIPVPAGHYRVLLSRGIEWSLVELEADVTETFSPLVEATLSHEVDPGDYIACDLHLHAAPSPDSLVSLEDRLVSLEAEGISFAVATDHNHVTDYAPTARTLGLTGMRSVTGVEVTTWNPAFGHFNVYPYPLAPERPENGAPGYEETAPAQLFQGLHAVDPDLVVQVNHPRAEGGIGYFSVMSFDPASGAADPRYSPDFDVVEVFNGFDLAVPERVEEVFGDFVSLLSRGQRVAATGSSDSHQVRYQLAGYPRTYAYVPPDAHADSRLIVRAVKRGQSFVTSGPFLEASIGDALPGAVVRAEGGKVVLHVKVRAPHWIDVDAVEVLVGGVRLIQEPIPPPKRFKPSALRFERDFDVPIAQDSFVIVRVTSKTTLDRFFGRQGVIAMAFTNPIFVDGDGDGLTPWGE